MLFWRFCVLLVLLGSCAGHRAAPGARTKAPRSVGFRLADADPPTPTPAPPTPAEPLAEDDAARILARIPPLLASTAPSGARAPATPPPTPSTTLPPPPLPREPGPPTGAPLSIVRHAPDGEVARAERFSVTFSEPMTALGEERVLGLGITPQVPGAWRWVGTQTLVFERDGELPHATDFTVGVPAGLTSLAGKKLERGETFRFSTGAPKLVDHSPQGERIGRTPLLLATFDQPVDPAEALRHLVLHAGDHVVPVRAATRAELDGTRGKHVLGFVPTEALPADARVVVELGPGLGGTEGPRRTTESQTWSFSTYDAFAFEAAVCPEPCLPSSTLGLRFTGSIEEDTFDPRWVHVTPLPEQLQVAATSSQVELSASWKPGVRYRIGVDPALHDSRGQPLAHEIVYEHSVKPYPSRLYGSPRLVVQSKPSFELYFTNLFSVDVQVRRVRPEDWNAFAHQPAGYPPPGELVFEKQLTVPHRDDAPAQASLDLAPALRDGTGQVLVVTKSRDSAQPADTSWVQVTHIGLTAFESRDGGLTVLTTDVASGLPLGRIDLAYGGRAAQSDANGNATLAGPFDRDLQLIGRHGIDSAFAVGFDGRGGTEVDDAVLFAFTDRGVYRPGETVQISGLVRHVGDDVQGAGSLVGRPLGVVVKTREGREIAHGSTTIGPLGSVHVELPLDARVPVGPLDLTFTGLARDAAPGLSFEVQEYRRAQLETTLVVERAESLVVGDAAVVRSDTHDFGGGAYAGATVNWHVRGKRAPFVPKGREAFRFGEEEPGEHATRSLAWLGTTNHAGEHRLRVDLERSDPYPREITVDAVVLDGAMDPTAARTTFLVHPALVTAGLRVPGYVRSGVPLPVDVIASDLAGALQVGRRVHVRSARIERIRRPGRVVEVEHDVAECDVSTQATAVPCQLVAGGAGRYVIAAEVLDDHGRLSRTAVSTWVTGEASEPPAAFEVFADRTAYAPGDVAQILVRSPIAPAEGMLDIGGVLTRFTLHGHVQTLAVPIDASRHGHGLAARVVLVGKEGDRHALLSHDLALQTPPTDRELAVRLVPRRAEQAPGEATDVDLEVSHPSGPHDLQALVYAVDDAVLAVTRYERPNPIDAFYTALARAAADQSTLRWVAGPPDDLPRAWDPLAFVAEDRTWQAGQHATGWRDEPPPIRLRESFLPLAVFADRVKLDAAGHATVHVQLPDSTTRYRVFALAYDGENLFGTAESSLVTRLPLTARLGVPRFANEGDRFELPVTVQNQTDAPLHVAVALRVRGGTLDGPTGRSVDVPARDRREVRFALAATAEGTMQLDVAAASGDLADASRAVVPVHALATTTAFATYGELDSNDAVAQALQLPAARDPQRGGLDMSIASSLRPGLREAAKALLAAAPGSNEAIATRVLAAAILHEPADLANDLRRLQARQHASGGFSFYDEKEDDPYLTAYVGLALGVAHERGVAIDADVRTQVLRALGALQLPRAYDPALVREVRAAALLASLHLGRPDARAARALWGELPPDASPETLAWLWPSLESVPDASVFRARVTETAAAAHVAQPARDDGWLVLASSQRTDALVLLALLTHAPNDPLVPKLARGLLDVPWTTSQGGGFALLALDAYLQRFERAPAHFMANAWVGTEAWLAHDFGAAEQLQVHVPMSQLHDAPLVLQRRGSGRAYYRLALEYAPQDSVQPAVDRGFTVARRYDAPFDHGAWHVPVGSTVRVTVTVVAQSERHHVALVDPLPAGFEALSVESASFSTHDELRDDLAETYTPRLEAGVYELVYLARATTRGSFVASPAQAREIYAPETFGRSVGERVVVE